MVRSILKPFIVHFFGCSRVFQLTSTWQNEPLPPLLPQAPTSEPLYETPFVRQIEIYYVRTIKVSLKVGIVSLGSVR